MTRRIIVDGLQCLCSPTYNSSRVAYILYPMDMLGQWLEGAAQKYDATIVVITGMDWESVFSPWPAKGVPKGSPDFKGQAPQFLATLQHKVIPQVESTLGLAADVERTLVGVSMSGLFTLWQWMLCDTFRNVACLSGSFWYEGFSDWIHRITIPAKTGKAYFLLGEQEPHSNVKAFNTVGQNTREILMLLRDAGIDAEFQSVPGNHFADPIPRLDKAFTALMGTKEKLGR